METLLFEKIDSVGVLRINRPKALNALNAQVIAELDELLTQVAEDRSVRALIITGEGEKSFVAGADIKEMEDHTPEQAFEMVQRGQKAFSKIENLRIPTIACVNGFALGGGLELALSCDVMVASTKAKMGLPEVSLGLIPGYGGTQRLARVVGANIACRMIFSGDMFKADQLRDWGLVSDVFEPEELWEKTLKIAQTMASRAPIALAHAKISLFEGLQGNLQEGLAIEALGFKEVFKTQDHSEGIQAFIEKRTPEFKGE